MTFTIRSMTAKTLVSVPNATSVGLPWVTALPGGGYVGVWHETVDGVSAPRQHLFDATGRLLTGSRVDDAKYAVTEEMIVTALLGGGYVATWRSSAGICQRSFGADGAPGEIRLITTGAGEFPVVTALPDGGYSVAEASGTDAKIIVQRFFRPDGSQVGQVAVNDPGPFGVSVRDVAILANGDYVVTWQPKDGTAAPGIYQRLFDKQGNAKGPETLIEYASEWGGDVTALTGGGYVVTSRLEGTFYQHAFGANGQEAGPRSAVGQGLKNVSVRATPDGFAVLWSDSWFNDAPSFQQAFDHLGNPIGGTTPVPYLGLKTDEWDFNWEVVTPLSDGRQVVMWRELDGVYQVHLGREDLPGLTAGTDLAQGSKEADVLVIVPGQLSPGDILNGREGVDVLQFGAPGAFDLRVPARLANIEEIRGSAGQDILFADARQLELFARVDLGDGNDVLVEALTGYPGTTPYRATRIDFGAGDDVLITDRIELEVGDRFTGTGIDMGPGFDVVRFTGSSFAFPTGASHGLRGVDGIAVNDPAQAASQTLRVTAAALGSLQLVDLGAGHDVLEIDGSGNLVLAQKSVLGVEVVTTAFPEWSDDEVLIIDAANLRNLLRIDLGYRPDLDDKDESLDVIKLVGGGIFDFSSKIISGVERIVVGGQSAATVIGTKGHDRIDGGSGRDVLRGLGGQDSIAGGSGSDRLEGDSGRDKLTGGRGLDTFVFDTKPGSTNFDRIVDFSVRDDRIWLDNAVFKKLGRGTPASPVKLGEDAFFKGAQADDPEDRIIYNPGTGAVSYDPDGIGRAPAVKFAQVRKGLPLTNADFFVV